jgi:DNA adenine methylase
MSSNIIQLSFELLNDYIMQPKAKPFLKWAGGKRQLLDQIESHFSYRLHNGSIKRYVEPFIGGGALFFHIAQRFDIEEFFISDINLELVLVYLGVQKEVEHLIELLSQLQAAYFDQSPDERKQFFYETCTQFNANRLHLDNPAGTQVTESSIMRAAQFIFLNRTCFNGLFRVNSKGGFNVPFGKYKKPKICDGKNLRAVSRILERATIRHGDFEICRDVVDADTFVYFDPPYRPISKTASFNSYSKGSFNDDSQKRLASFFCEFDQKGAQLILSNSDPHNENPEDDFFETIYHGFNIHKVMAKRMINSKGKKRGAITELLITNY